MRRFVVLVVVLLMIGCGEDVGETAVMPTTSVVVERPLPTATVTSQPQTPTTTSTKIPRETPQPPSSPMPTQIPTPTPLPPLFFGMINDDIQLKVRQSFEPFFISHVVNANEGKVLLVLDTFRQDGINIRDYATNQDIYHLPESPITISDHMIFQLTEDNQLTKLTTYDLFSGAIIWESLLPNADWKDPMLVGDSIILFSQGTEFNTSSIHLFDQQTGNYLWQNEVTARCYSSIETIEIQNVINISCYDSYFSLNKSTGQLLYEYSLPEYSDLQSFESVENQLLLIRKEENNDGAFVRTTYLQSVNPQDLDQIFWQKQLDNSVFSFELFQGDVIYRFENHVIRINGRNGETIWDTKLTTHRPSNLLIVDKWLFAGSINGVLHLLDGTTGKVVWEQDIWATLEPRPILISPIGWTGTSLIIYSEHEVLALGIQGETNWLAPNTNPVSTPIATLTQTPIPILPTIEPGTAPQPPSSIETWPEHVLAILNSDTFELPELEQTLSHWLASTPSAGPNSAVIVEAVDLNGDQAEDVVVHIYNWPGWIFVFLHTSLNQYEIAWIQNVTTSQLLAIDDLNQDGLIDFMYTDTIYGASQSTTTIYPVGWQNGEFKELSTNPISSTNVWKGIQVEDIDADGFIDIIFEGGTFGSAAAGPNRPSTFTYSMRNGKYELVSQEPTLPQDYFFFVVEANQLLTSGNLEEAITLYENTMDTDDALYFYNTPHQQAFAEFQLMLAYLLLNDESSAATYAKTGNYPDQFYSEVKQIFWETFQATHDWAKAAEVTRTHVRLAGFQKAQLDDWVGYANKPLDLNDIVPCEECLQGSIGSLYWP